jgi:carboxypeptidase PM20D1
MMKRLGFVVFALAAALALIVTVRTALVRSRQLSVPKVARVPIDPQAVARLSRAVQFRTVTYADGPAGDHAAFVEWLKSAYPRVHAEMAPELVAGHSLLFAWRGSDPSLKPLLLTGHYDVVPVEPDAERRWSVPPFSGLVRDGFIWGRGSLDDKPTVLGILEAADMLLRDGWRPRRTILFAFGHDEERGGEHGAQSVARLLESRGVRLEAVIDEGGVIAQGLASGVAAPVALIGTGEKGFVSIELAASGPGGHSAMPPRETPVAIVAAAVGQVQQHPLSSRITRSTRTMLEALAPEMGLGMRMIAANLWLTKPLLTLQARNSDSLRAMLQTTSAATIIGGGVKDNVIPAEAHAVINFRILPGETPESVAAYTRRVVSDRRVRVRAIGEHPRGPSPESDSNAPQFMVLARTIRQLFPGTVVAPYLVIGGTDARYYGQLSPNVYRFVPLHLRKEDMARAHGMNERIAVTDYLDAIRFYHLLMKNFAA